MSLARIENLRRAWFPPGGGSLEEHVNWAFDLPIPIDVDIRMVYIKGVARRPVMSESITKTGKQAGYNKRSARWMFSPRMSKANTIRTYEDGRWELRTGFDMKSAPLAAGTGSASLSQAIKSL